MVSIYAQPYDLLESHLECSGYSTNKVSLPQTSMACGPARTAGIGTENQRALKTSTTSSEYIGLINLTSTIGSYSVARPYESSYEHPHDLQGKHECPAGSPTRSPNMSVSLCGFAIGYFPCLLGDSPRKRKFLIQALMPCEALKNGVEFVRFALFDMRPPSRFVH